MSAGKGDKNRVRNFAQYRANYEAINWKRKDESKSKQISETNQERSSRRIRCA